MKKPVYNFKGKVWLYPDREHQSKNAAAMQGAWYFITLPKKQSKEIEERYSGPFRRGWGSVPVAVTIGNTIWNTSIFPDKIAGAYLLPVKREVREKEGIEPNKGIIYSIEIKA